MTRDFAGDIDIVGTTAGLHVVVWFNTICSGQEARFADIARNQDIGIYPVARLFLSPTDGRARYVFGPPAGSGSDNGKFLIVTQFSLAAT